MAVWLERAALRRAAGVYAMISRCLVALFVALMGINDLSAWNTWCLKIPGTIISSEVLGEGITAELAWRENHRACPRYDVEGLGMAVVVERSPSLSRRVREIGLTCMSRLDHPIQRL